MLYPNSVHRAEIISETPIFYKIETKDQFVPLYLEVEKASKGDLKIYGSFNTTMPKPTNC